MECTLLLRNLLALKGVLRNSKTALEDVRGIRRVIPKVDIILTRSTEFPHLFNVPQILGIEQYQATSSSLVLSSFSISCMISSKLFSINTNLLNLVVTIIGWYCVCIGVTGAGEIKIKL